MMPIMILKSIGSFFFTWKDKRNAIIALMVVVIGFLLCMQKCNRNAAFDCDSCTEVVKVKHDTIFVKDKPITVVTGKPEPVHTWPVKPHAPVPVVVKVDTVYMPDGAIVINHPCPDQALTTCDSGRYYKLDTLIDQVHIILKDSVTGRIDWRKVELVNLKPAVVTTITKTVKEKVKVYLGCSVTINARNMNRWGIGPSGLISIPKVGAIGYSYDARNNAHAGSLYALIRFKK